MPLENLCVYCGSAFGGDPFFAAAATRLGEILAHRNIRLVYGGGSIGLMGNLARAVLSKGGAVTGVIPSFLKDREVMLKDVPDLVITEGMHERKRAMFDAADAFVALPGGIGTLDEVIEMMTWAQLGRHTKPIVIANLKGFWDPLLALFDHMEQGGFLRKSRSSDRRLHLVAETIEAIVPLIELALADGHAHPTLAPGMPG
ncbi:MAG: TIGR00730 family Rossman fold protein [Bauldia sp.]